VQPRRDKYQFLHGATISRRMGDHPARNEKLMQEQSKPNILKGKGSTLDH